MSDLDRSRNKEFFEDLKNILNKYEVVIVSPSSVIEFSGEGVCAESVSDIAVFIDSESCSLLGDQRYYDKPINADSVLHTNEMKAMMYDSLLKRSVELGA